MRTFEATARAEHGGWDVEIPEADKSHTWAPTLRKAVLYAREVAAGWFDLALENIAVTVTVDGAADELNAARSKRAEADNAACEAAEATRRAVTHLAQMGLADRDVATVVGLSHQRVHQLRTGT